MKISAVVVTYNRLKLLKEVISLLKQQTQPLQEIIVVNNDSTDGTREWLEKEKDIIVINQANLGGAGGFETGVKYAYENKADWVWMMDDDVFPETNCLENLLKWTDISECIQPIRYYADKVYVNSESWLYPKLYHVFSSTNNSAFINKKKFTAINVGCFEGMFISKNIISKIGFPDKRFFIAGDDVVYGFKAHFFTNVILVNNARMNRTRKSTDFSISPMYIYYQIRNTHLINEYLESTLKDKNSTLRSFILLLRFFKQLLIIVIRYPHKYRYCKALFRGLIDNYHKKIGKTH